MAAEIHFSARSEPSKMICIVLFHCKCGLGEIVLNRYVLHETVFWPLIKYADRGLITAEDSVRKSIDYILFHILPSKSFSIQIQL